MVDSTNLRANTNPKETADNTNLRANTNPKETADNINLKVNLNLKETVDNINLKVNLNPKETVDNTNLKANLNPKEMVETLLLPQHPPQRLCSQITHFMHVSMKEQELLNAQLVLFSKSTVPTMGVNLQLCAP